MADLRRGAAVPLVALLAVALLAGCTTTGQPDPPPASGGAASPADASTTAEPVGQEYRYRGYAIGSADGDDVLLCGSVVLQSLPPQCGDGGVAVRGWDWSATGADSASGRRFGEVDVVGTWDESTSTFTVTRAPTEDVRVSVGTEARGGTRCPEPADGWESLAPADPALADFHGAYAAVLAVDGVAAAWVGRNPGSAKPLWTVLNVSTAGDVAPVEAAARQHWGGPLCVTADAERSAADLDAIRTEVQAAHPEVGILNTDGMTGTVFGMMWVVPETLTAELDERYGAGVVTIDAFLEPVD